MGMDTISLGNVLGFAMELNEKGLWDNGLNFGETEKVSGIIEDIAHRKGIGDDLADGVKRLSEKYGGEEYAMHSKGMELPSYEPRGAVGHGLGYAVSNRGGCHIGGGYLVYFEANGPLTMDPLTTRAKAELVAFFQTLLDALSDAGSCQFTAFTTVPKQAISMNPHGLLYRILAKSMELMGPMLNFLLKYPKIMAFVPPMEVMQHPKALTDLTGMKMTLGKFIEAGLRTYIIERMYNMREGISGAEDRLPARSTRDAQGPDPKSKVPLDRMLPAYYRVRGLESDGAPGASTLARLHIRA
jgi:aldehyde:ferredoxin oxidoreductase